MTILQPCIKIQAYSQYVPTESVPRHQRYVFSYLITIKNLSQEPVQLLARRWLITDANGKQITAEGDGIIGEQPIIAANDEYSYSSGTVLATPVGVMQGNYAMQTLNGQRFMVNIDPFRLAIPNILN